MANAKLLTGHIFCQYLHIEYCQIFNLKVDSFNFLCHYCECIFASLAETDPFTSAVATKSTGDW